MPSLGFSLETNFTRQTAPRRRGVGRQLDDIDALVADQAPRSPTRTVIGLALIAAAVAVVALHDQAGSLLAALAGWN